MLQEGEFERVGGTTTQKVNVRVIAATNRDLKKAADEGQFRSDLYYRLAGFPIHVAPLRERSADIRAFVQHFVAKFARRIGRPIDKVSQPVFDALAAYHWPGNVRELEHVIERAVILRSGDRLELGDWVPRASAQPMPVAQKTLQGYERQHILDALEAARWKVSGLGGAAERLGLKPTTLEDKLAIRRPR